MSRPLRVELTGGIYHVVARGNERRPIFRDDQDREEYLGRLADCRSRFGFRVLAYCLMDNHVHLALERGPVALSRIMLHLHSYYAQRFNWRHGRVGHLFQGRYRAHLVETERYFFSLVRYIHGNPVAAGVVTRPEAFRWSSDRHYRAGGGPVWLDADVLLDRLHAERATAASVYRRLMARAEEQTYEDVPSFLRAIKGESEFAQRTLAMIGEARIAPTGWTPERLAESVARAEGLSLDELRRPRRVLRESRVRLIAAYLGKRDCGLSTAAMARCFGREESTFSRGVRRLEDSIAQDLSLKSRIEALATLVRDPNTGIHD